MGYKPRSRPNDANDAVVLVRRRPGMYIGDTYDGSGLHHMLWEVLANSLDEHLSGHGSDIDIVLHADGSFAVADRGRGISIADERGRPFAERAFLELHNTATRDGHAPHVHVGSFGVGLAVVNRAQRVSSRGYLPRRWALESGFCAGSACPTSLQVR